MAYLLPAASFAAFFFALLLTGKKSKALYDRILLNWQIYLGVFTALYFFAGQQRISNSSWFYTSVVALFLLHGPFLYAYTTVLTSGKKKLVKNDVLHFIPCFLFLIYLAIAFQFPTYSAGITLDHVHTALRPPILFVLFLLLTAASGPIYFYLSLLRVKDYKIRIQNNFSALDQANLEWLKILLLIFGVVWTVLILIAIAHHIFHFSSMDFCINGLFASLSVFIVLLGYFGFRQQEIFRHIPAEGFLEPDSIPLETEKSTQKTSEKYRGMYMSPEEMDAYVRRINQFMEEQKPYLDPELTLGVLADQLMIPTHQLSRVINEHFGRNFFDFINGYRVAEVKRKILDPAYAHFSLLGIAFESGFNSKSAFNRVFKKITGQTPSQFKESGTKS